MVIECRVCQARSRMRESMMRGFQGAEVRGRKCGGIIVIMNTATVPGPAVPSAPAGETRAHRQPSPPGEISGIPARQEPSSPEHARRGPPPSERKAQPGTALAEETDIEEAVPDNVYSLEPFREIRTRRLPSDGFGITGYIRPEPSAPPAPHVPPEFRHRFRLSAAAPRRRSRVPGGSPHRPPVRLPLTLLARRVGRKIFLHRQGNNLPPVSSNKKTNRGRRNAWANC